MRATGNSVPQSFPSVEPSHARDFRQAVSQTAPLSTCDLSSQLEDLEHQAEAAFLKYFSTKEDLGPSPEWSHIVDPLYRDWQAIEHALCLVRCI